MPSALAMDANGDLYGTTLLGGSEQSGTVFKLAHPPAIGAEWTEYLLYQFSGAEADGQLPYSSLTFHSSGNLYGTSFLGGANNLGLAFELTPPVTGSGGCLDSGAVVYLHRRH